MIDNVVRVFKWRLLLLAHSIYRDLAAEKIALILKHCHVTVNPTIKLSEEQERRLKGYLSGKLEFESAHDAAYLAVLNELAKRQELDDIDNKHLIGIIARVVQGKPLDEVANILEVPVDEAQGIVDEGIRELLK